LRDPKVDGCTAVLVHVARAYDLALRCVTSTLLVHLEESHRGRATCSKSDLLNIAYDLNASAALPLQAQRGIGLKLRRRGNSVRVRALPARASEVRSANTSDAIVNGNLFCWYNASSLHERYEWQER